MIRLTLFLLYLALLAVSLPARSQSSNQNYITTRTYYQAGLPETSGGTTYAGTPRQVATQITYLDGLGQPALEVAPYTGPLYQDLVIRHQYDDQLRSQKQYLPVAVSGNNGGFVSSPSTSYYNSSQVCNPTPDAFIQTTYEFSPLNRVSETKAPGVTGQGIQQVYGLNSANSVKRYSTLGPTLYHLDLNQGYYPEKALTYSQSQDENGYTVQVYYDSYKRLILRRVFSNGVNLDTYYVYNESGLLRAVFQPMFQDYGDAGLYASLYEYDSRGRMVKKKIPGSGEESLSYDTRDRLVSRVDARGKRFYYSYDELNRLVESGLCNDGSCTSKDLLIKNYYDTYPSGYFAFDNTLNLTASEHFVPTNPTSVNRNGLLTGTTVRQLSDDGTLGNYLPSTLIYDDKGRLIQVARQLIGNLTSGTPVERVTYQLDFAGRTLKSRTTQLTESGKYQLDQQMAYEQGDRPTYISYKVYENDVLKKQFNHSQLMYNQVGQLSKKKLHQQLLDLSYQYTPRGWLCSQQSLGNFSQNLTYYSNGNVETQTSSTNGQPAGQASYSYDMVNQLSGYTSSGSWAGYAESNLNYDKNGNLTSLNRTNGGTQIDQLSYLYNGNQVHRINDLSGSGLGFNNGYNSDNELVYDAVGNLVKDYNQSIGTASTDGIFYNLLNLPYKVTQGSQYVTYTYDAQGNKRQLNVSGGEKTTYEGRFEYNKNGILSRIGLEEGQLIRDVSGAYSVQYYLKDHLGNVRMVMHENGSVLQKTDYYAFGLTIFKDTSSIATNKYLYNGKEQQTLTNWLDYGARMYNPSIGRWFNVDPMAEKTRRWSPYTYGFNNPLRFIDPDGMSSINAIEKGGASTYELFYQNPTEGASLDLESGPGKGKNATGIIVKDVTVRPEGSYGSGGLAYRTDTKGVVAGFSAGYLKQGKSGGIDANVTGFRAEYTNFSGRGKVRGALEAGVKLTGLQGTANISAGTEDRNIGVAAEGNAILAEAKGSAGYFSGENEKHGIQYAAEAGVYALKGEVNPSITIGGTKAGFTLGGCIGCLNAGGGFGVWRDATKGTVTIGGYITGSILGGGKAGFEITVPGF